MRAQKNIAWQGMQDPERPFVVSLALRRPTLLMTAMSAAVPIIRKVGRFFSISCTRLRFFMHRIHRYGYCDRAIQGPRSEGFYRVVSREIGFSKDNREFT